MNRYHEAFRCVHIVSVRYTISTSQNLPQYTHNTTMFGYNNNNNIQNQNKCPNSNVNGPDLINHPTFFTFLWHNFEKFTKNIFFLARHPAVGQRYLATYGEGSINLFGRFVHRGIFLSISHYIVSQKLTRLNLYIL